MAGLALLAGCGSKVPDRGPRAVVESFGKASAARDYQQICDELIAPALVRSVERVGLPCEIAFERGLGGVRSPRLTVGAVRVVGPAAYVETSSTALGQPPSHDTVKLVRAAGRWRIAALSSTPPPAVAAPPPARPPASTVGIPPGAIPAR